MDQSAFRSLLASQASTSGSSSTSTSQAHSRAGGGGSRSSFGGGKQRLGIGAGFGGQRREQGIPDAATHKSSVEQFRPRQQKSASSSSVSKGKAKEEDKVEEQPKYKKYGYTDRASMRRAGLDEAEIAEAQEERRPRGRLCS